MDLAVSSACMMICTPEYSGIRNQPTKQQMQCLLRDCTTQDTTFDQIQAETPVARRKPFRSLSKDISGNWTRRMDREAITESPTARDHFERCATAYA